MHSLTHIREILAQRGLSPQKRFGQNFLIDQNLGRKLVDAAAIGPGDLVLEVGPGTGTLSEELLARGCELVACELDRGLCALLRDHFAHALADAHPRLTLIEGDCLARDRSLARPIVDALAGRPFHLVANLPYGAASPLISTLLIHHPNCLAMHVTIQREVADKLNARPATKTFGPMALLARVCARIETIAILPPECFWPRPEVTSAMVSIVRTQDPTLPARHLPDFSEFLTHLFAQRRKQIRAVLAFSDLPDDVPPNARAESLSVEQTIALWRIWKERHTHDDPRETSG